MEKIKTIIKKAPGIRSAYKKGFFSKSKRKLLIVNFIFQRIFRINSDCPWSVHYTSVVTAPNKIKLGVNSERSFLRSPNCYIQAINGVEVGDNVLWGPGVGIISANHDDSQRLEHKKEKPVKIGNNVWIGMNSIILPGVELGNNVIVGAGSVVTKSFPDNVIIAGNPARIIR